MQLPSRGGQPKPLGTGYRGIGSRQGNTVISNQGQFNTIGMNTNLNLSDRPLTNQGLGTAGRTTAQGPRRRFHDRTYYVSKIKTANRELTKEIEKFQKEIETIKKDHDVYIQ